YYLGRGDGTAAQKCAEEATALTDKSGFVSFSAMATVSHGAALIAQGRYEEGIAAMRRGISAFHATGGKPLPTSVSCLASGLGKIGLPGEGLQVLEEEFASVAKAGAQWGAFLHHVK